MGNQVSFENIEETSNHKKCRCRSWIGHYRTGIGKKDKKYFECSVCREICRLGAHVQYRGVWYITPLCEKCNHHTNKDIMKLKRNKLVYLKKVGDKKYICQAEKDIRKWKNIDRKSCVIL